MSPQANDVTTILAAIRGGDEKATDQLLSVVYSRLRRLGQQMLAHEKPGQTLQATALVHEAYLRLLGDGDTAWEDRHQAIASTAPVLFEMNMIRPPLFELNMILVPLHVVMADLFRLLAPLARSMPLCDNQACQRPRICRFFLAVGSIHRGR